MALTRASLAMYIDIVAEVIKLGLGTLIAKINVNMPIDKSLSTKWQAILQTLTYATTATFFYHKPAVSLESS